MPGLAALLPALMLAVDKHKIGGIVAIVVGAAVALFGLFRVVQRLSGAAIYLGIGIVIAVLGVLTYTHTIHS